MQEEVYTTFKEEAIDYCYKNKDKFIKDCESVSKGIREFDCLISCLEEGTIKPEELADYGMNY